MKKMIPLIFYSLIFVSCNPAISNLSATTESRSEPIVVLQSTPNPTRIIAENTAVSPHTPTPRPLATRTSIPTSVPMVAATPEATATAKVLLITPNPDEPVCSRPSDLEETEVNVLVEPFCIVWVDKFDDEAGFRILLEYAQSGERFIYEVEPDTTQLVVPKIDAPRLSESLEQCQRRKDWQISVIALRSGSQHPFGGMAVTIECGGMNGGGLPTATP